MVSPFLYVAATGCNFYGLPVLYTRPSYYSACPFSVQYILYKKSARPLQNLLYPFYKFYHAVNTRLCREAESPGPISTMHSSSKHSFSRAHSLSFGDPCKLRTHSLANCIKNMPGINARHKQYLLFPFLGRWQDYRFVSCTQARRSAYLIGRSLSKPFPLFI